MHSPVIFSLGLATAFASLSAGHTVFTTLFVDDVNQGDGTCIRMSKKGDVSTHPIAGGLDTPDMACGRDGQEAVAFTLPAAAGSKLTLEFRMWADASQPGSIDPSHLGPIAVYLKPVSDMKTDEAAGPGWFKIWDEGYDAAAKKWATEKLIDNNGLLSLNLPSALPTGYYLARHETITLQNVTNDKPDAQFYVGCAQLFIQGTASSDSSPIPSDKQVSIPGHIQAGDPGLTHNVYKDDPITYKLVGPPVFFPGSTSSTSTKPKPKPKSRARRQPPAATTEQTQGLIPPSCLVKNANWCGAALPAYADEAGCWAAGEACFKQLDDCYATAPPTGSKGCRVWEDEMCAAIQSACRAGKFQGPPAGQGGQKLAGADVVDEPVPGGKIPEAVNAGESGSGSGNGGGGAAQTATATATAVDAPEATKVSRCKNRRRREQRARKLD
ncbi:hypothetical protein NEMBOFW57_007737 [Staphylotrichum longicolle]|uniref:lytic cellulose monooxygenase (C4-dehydrogenating) n=1 Tax=Staphylotrichum longicolle TaxID=669026 RepID=A0AAD4EVF3_9PEZI|nr:hypothetical protein NEMBOFW57_007737 [Staphylotrichum longicolle]